LACLAPEARGGPTESVRFCSGPSRLKHTTEQATRTNATTAPSPDPSGPAAAGSSSATTATARPSSGAAQAAPTTPPHAESDPRPHPTSAQIGPVGSAVIAFVGVDLGRSSAPPPNSRADRRNVLHDRLEHGGVARVGGGDGRGQRQPAAVADQVKLAPGLATIDRICAHMVPRVWRARSWCPRWPATSPAGPARPAGPTPPGGAGRTPRPWPTRSAGASRSRASHSQARGRAAAATEWRCEPCR
jgi:hypothetical protein